MIQEDKELLLKDLCARIPYHPKGLMINVCTGDKYEEWLNYSTFTTFTATIFTAVQIVVVCIFVQCQV